MKTEDSGGKVRGIVRFDCEQLTYLAAQADRQRSREQVVTCIHGYGASGMMAMSVVVAATMWTGWRYGPVMGEANGMVHLEHFVCIDSGIDRFRFVAKQNKPLFAGRRSSSSKLTTLESFKSETREGSSDVVKASIDCFTYGCIVTGQ